MNGITQLPNNILNQAKQIQHCIRVIGPNSAKQKQEYIRRITIANHWTNLSQADLTLLRLCTLLFKVTCDTWSLEESRPFTYRWKLSMSLTAFNDNWFLNHVIPDIFLINSTFGQTQVTWNSLAGGPILPTTPGQKGQTRFLPGPCVWLFLQ